MNGLIGSLSTTISFFLEQILMEGGEELKSLARCRVWNVRKFVDSSLTKKGKNLQSPTFHSILIIIIVAVIIVRIRGPRTYLKVKARLSF